jgi:hypothetical protein
VEQGLIPGFAPVAEATRIILPAQDDIFGIERKRCAAGIAEKHLRRKIGLLDLDSISVQRPVPQRLRLAEFLLRQFRGVAFTRGVDLEGTLANLALATVFAEHVFHKPDDKS